MAVSRFQQSAVICRAGSRAAKERCWLHGLGAAGDSRDDSAGKDDLWITLLTIANTDNHNLNHAHSHHSDLQRK